MNMSQINTITAPEGHWLNRGEIWVKTISSYGDTSDWVVKTQSDKDKWDAEHPQDEPNMPGGG